MSILAAAVLGIVEGITEFLPISSTGHLIIAERLLGITITESVRTFDIVIQLGAIAAVVVVSWEHLWKSYRTLLGVAAAFLPTAIIGLLLHGIAKKYLLGNVSVVLWSLLIGGILLIVFEKLRPKQRKEICDLSAIPLWKAAIIGCCQALAIIPGVSRSAATIVGGMLLGVERQAIVEFSFLLAIPTMAAATGLDLYKSMHVLTNQDLTVIAVGFVFSFFTALLSLKWLLSFIKTHTFSPFGVERIVVAVLAWIVLLKRP